MTSRERCLSVPCSVFLIYLVVLSLNKRLLNIPEETRELSSVSSRCECVCYTTQHNTTMCAVKELQKSHNQTANICRLNPDWSAHFGEDTSEHHSIKETQCVTNTTHTLQTVSLCWMSLKHWMNITSEHQFYSSTFIPKSNVLASEQYILIQPNIIELPNGAKDGLETTFRDVLNSSNLLNSFRTQTRHRYILHALGTVIHRSYYISKKNRIKKYS